MNRHSLAQTTVVLLLVIVTGCNAPAGDPVRLKKVEAELAAVQKEIDATEKELEVQRQKAESLRQEIAKLSGAPKSSITPAKLIETLNLPENARPKDESDKIRMDRLNEWLAKNGKGKRVNLECPSARTYNPLIQKIDDKKKLYSVTIFMSGPVKLYELGIAVEVIVFQTDEQTAEWIQDIFKSESGTAKTTVDFTVTGRIESLSLATSNDLRVFATLADATVPE